MRDMVQSGSEEGQDLANGLVRVDWDDHVCNPERLEQELQDLTD
jgi:hypothetical protein